MRTHCFFGLLLLAIIATISSCMQGTERIGELNDSIKLSTRRADFSATNDSIIITTKGALWLVNDILVNGNYLIFNPVETEKENFAINAGWFSIEKYNNTQLKVRVSENTSAEERNIKIVLESGGYFDHIDVNQLGRH